MNFEQVFTLQFYSVIEVFLLAATWWLVASIRS